MTDRQRRQLLRAATAGTLGGWTMASLAQPRERPTGATSRDAGETGLGPAGAAGTAGSHDRRLIVIMLRGAVDGLSVVAPYLETNYHRLRPTIGLPRPGETDGLIDLDGRFGLHPALAMLKPLWDQGTLGFVHAAGSPDATRSHFDAQDYLESGTPGRKTTPTGWMNRLLAMLNPGAPLLRAVNVGPVMPRIYAGPGQIAHLASGDAALRATALDRAPVHDAFAALYTDDDALSRAFREAGQTRREIMASLTGSDAQADNGAVSLRGFAQDAQRLGSLMQRDARVQLGFIAVGGWDTHVNQGSAQGSLAQKLGQLGDGLQALNRGLGQRQRDTLVVVLSEFGRTVRQNGNGGTDHGHGNVIWLMGGAAHGGRVHGEWPGLEDRALHDGRDLAITSDFRSVLSEIAAQHLRLNDRQLADLFPDAPATLSRLGLVRKA